jgi:hypothetical protein
VDARTVRRTEGPRLSRILLVRRLAALADASNVARPAGPGLVASCPLCRSRRLTTGGTATATTREAAKVRERLERNRYELRRVRATERVLMEQVAYLDEVATDAETRRLVAETPLADREWREARTDLDRHTALLEEARQDAIRLLTERDRLLDRLLELEGPT